MWNNIASLPPICVNLSHLALEHLFLAYASHVDIVKHSEQCCIIEQIHNSSFRSCHSLCKISYYLSSDLSFFLTMWPINSSIFVWRKNKIAASIWSHMLYQFWYRVTTILSNFYIQFIEWRWTTEWTTTGIWTRPCTFFTFKLNTICPIRVCVFMCASHFIELYMQVEPRGILLLTKNAILSL